MLTVAQIYSTIPLIATILNAKEIFAALLSGLMVVAKSIIRMVTDAQTNQIFTAMIKATTFSAIHLIAPQVLLGHFNVSKVGCTLAGEATRQRAQTTIRTDASREERLFTVPKISNAVDHKLMILHVTTVNSIALQPQETASIVRLDIIPATGRDISVLERNLMSGRGVMLTT